jgi:hypothetical protein
LGGKGVWLSGLGKGIQYMNGLRRSPAVVALALGLGVLGLAGPGVCAGTGVPLSDTELETVYGGAEDEAERVPTHVTQIETTMSQNITGSQNASSAMILINSLSSSVTAQVNVIANFGGTVGQASQANIGISRASR